MERSPSFRVKPIVIALSLCILAGLVVRAASKRDALPPVARGTPDRATAASPPRLPPPAHPRGPIELRGRVIHEDGSPFVGVLTITECESFIREETPWPGAMRIPGADSDQGFPVTVRTDADGRFTGPGRRAGAVAVTAEVDGGTLLLASALPVPFVGDLKLVIGAPNGWIEGRILSAEDEQPIAMAQVEARIRFGLNGPALAATRTDGEGRFRIPRPAGDHELIVTAGGFTARTFGGTDAGNRPVVRLARCGAVSGRALDAAGTGAPGVTVFLDERDTACDANGQFTFDEVPAGWHDLSARGRGLLLDAPRRVFVEPGNRAAVTLTLTPGLTIEGLVVNERGGPIAGTEVTAGSPVAAGGDAPVRTRSGADGSFSFPALNPDRNYWIEALAPGRKPVLVGPLRGGPGETRTATLDLDVAFELPVRVVTAGTAEPIHGAKIVLLANDRDIHRERTWLTDSTGLAILDSLPDGPVRLDIRHPQHLRPEPPIYCSGERQPAPLLVALVPGESIVSGVELNDEALPREITFRILGPDGRPVPSAWITGRRTDVSLCESAGVVDGVAVLRLPDSEAEFVFRIGGARSLAGEVLPFRPVTLGPVRLADIKAEVTLEPGLSITGRLLGPAGDPLPHTLVGSRLLRSEEWAGWPEGPSTVSDGEGRFELRGLDRGPYEIAAWLPEELRCEPVTVPAGATGLEIRAAREPAIRLRVRDTLGELVPGVRVRLVEHRPRFPSRIQTMTGPDGVALLYGCRPGRSYRLELLPPLARRDLVPLEREHWLPEETTFQLRAGLFIRGRIDDRENLGLRHAVVVAEWPDGLQTAMPFHDGTFEIGPLPDVRMELWAMPAELAPGNWVGRRAVTLPGVAGLVLPFERLLPLTIRLTNLEGVHWKDSAFAVSEQTGRAMEGTLTREWVSFTGLPADGSYTLLARSVATGMCAQWNDLRPNAAELAIALVPGQSITGRLELPRAARLPKVFAHRGAAHFAGEVEADGAFRIEGLPAGDWEIRVTFKSGNVAITQWAEARTGEAITLDLR